MTVLDNTPRDQYTATGGQVAFSYTFEIAAEGDIAVLQNGTLLNLGAGAGEYAVTGVGSDSGGVITLVTGATAGDIITIYRDMALERLTSYTNGGDFLAADVNNDYDRLWLALQQNTGVSTRALVAPNTDPTDINMTIPGKTTRLGKLLQFNATTGNPEVVSPFITGQVVSVTEFGATGDGTTNDTVAVQAAIDSIPNGGTIYFPPGTYRIARTVGTNDSWGLKVTANNITLMGNDAYLRRYDTDISTYALSYPILFVGTPDSNGASQTINFTADSLKFIGEDTQHAISGSAPSDKRNAIEFKNTNSTTVRNCQFTSTDSAAIFYQYPVMYDYGNSVHYNTTKNYNSEITNCRFYANAHAVVGRALIHLFNCRGVDQIIIDSNYFQWCDVVLSGEGTYSGLNQSEDSLYTPSEAGWALGDVKRTGRDWLFSNNIVVNSSEHAVYASGMNATISGNTFRAENSTVCIGDIKIRSIGAVVTGNSITTGATGGGVSVSTPSYHVSITGNIIYSDSLTSVGGVIGIDSNDLTTYIDARAWLTAYQAMENITISGNSIRLPDSTATGVNHVGIRIYSSDSDTNFPEGQLRNVTVSGNDIKNHRHGVYVIGRMARNIVIEGNTFDAKPYTSAGFGAGTTMNTETSLMIYKTSTNAARDVVFRDNFVSGSNYLFATNDSGGTSVDIPWGITDNYLYAIKNFKTTDMRTPAQYNAFRDNTGYYFLDRTGWIGAHSLGNSLSNGVSSNTGLKYNLAYNGTNIIFYTDDVGTRITL